MSSVDERIVRMMFDNGDFQRKIGPTLSALEQLKKGMQLTGATKGLDDLNSAAKRFSLDGMAQGIESIKSKFGVLSVVALTALTNITNKAVTAGLTLVKSLTVGPISSGLHEYETQLNSIQTILANTGLMGQKGLNQVNKALSQLNTYSDKTIYNFGEMARNIGTFTAAGVELDTSVNAIKGIANLAAISGSSSEQASTAMYQLSQALATGTVKLIDWNSVVNAGMGGKVFQESLKETARAHGVAVDDIIKDEGSFRDSLQKGWLTSEVLTETLSKFTGDLNASQLKTMGYNEKQIAGILKMGKTAQDAATKVKTVSQLIGTLQEAAGSGWAKTWQLIFGDFEEARTLFTNVNNVLSGFITASADARNKVLGDWKALGGRTALIDGISNAFHALIAVVKPIGAAFRSIFPATTGQQLYDMTVAFRDFAAGLKIGADTANKLQRTFAGVFAVLNIGKTIIIEAVKLLLRLFGAAGEGSGSFLGVTASIGDFLVKVNDALTKGGLLALVFSKIGDVLEIPIKLIKALGSVLAAAFSNIDFGGVGKGLNGIISPLGVLAGLGDLVTSAWNKVIHSLDTVWQKFLTFASNVANASGGLGESLASGFTGLNFDNVLGGIQTGLFASVVLILRKFTKGILGALTNLGGSKSTGLLDTIKESFGGLTDTLKTMQSALSAATLLAIAAAVGILTVSVIALSKIDAAGLTKALTAIAVMITQLSAAMLVLSKFGGAGFAQLIPAAAAMILLATAVNILASAVKKLADLDWNGLAKGLTGVTVLLIALSAAAKLMSGNTAGLITAGAGFILLAAAIKILVSAVSDLSGLSWEELGQGLVGVGALLASLAIFTKFAAVNKGGVASGAGLILLAVGIKVLASAVEDFAGTSWEGLAKGLISITAILAAFAIFSKTIGNPLSLLASGAALIMISAAMNILAMAVAKFGSMSWEVIGKGLLSMSVALFSIAVALAALPPTTLLSAAAILVVAASLGLIANAMIKLGGMTWTEIAKGLIVLAASLLIIAAALYAMTGALPGAAAVLVVAAALAILTPVLIAIGGMSWGAIAKGLLTIAAAFIIFGVAGLLLAPVVPVLIGLGIAVALLGIAMLAAGVGVLAFSVGLTALAVAGVAAVAAIVGIVKGLVGLIPYVMTQIANGIIAFAKVIATAGPSITKAIVTVLNAFMNAIITVTPKVVSLLLNMITKMLDALGNAVPKMISAGAKILVGILEGIRDNIARIVTVGLQVVTNFINGVSNGLGKVVAAGVKLIISFVNSVASAIRSNSSEMGAAGANLGMAVVEGMVRGIAGGIGAITSAAGRVARSALSSAKSALGVGSPSKEFYTLGMQSDQGLGNGLDDYADIVKKSAEGVGIDAILALSKSISGISDIITSDIDMTPTITPVLDLTNIRKDAAAIGSMLTSQNISVGAAYSTAKDASTGYSTNQEALVEVASNTSGSQDSFTFNQYNTSPKALSEAEIYRQTKNQLSVAKGAL